MAQDKEGLGESELVCHVYGGQIWVGVFVVVWLCCQGIGAFAGIPVMLQDKQTEAPWVVCIVLVVVGLLSLAVGVSTLLRIVRTVGLEVEAFTEGLDWRQRARSGVWRWSDIQFVWRHQFAVPPGAVETLPMRFFFYACGNRTVFTVEGTDGERLTLNGYLHDVNALTDLILEHTLRIRLRKNIASYEAGKTVPFGELEVSREGIGRKGETLPWDEVEEVRLAEGWVTVMRADTKKPWCQLRDSRIPNTHLLAALVEAVKKNEGSRRRSK